jgi:hypothetical protein
MNVFLVLAILDDANDTIQFLPTPLGLLMHTPLIKSRSANTISLSEMIIS